MKSFNTIELIFDEGMNGFDIGLPSVGGRWNGVMNQAVDRLNGFRKHTIVTGIPSANKFTAMVGLKAPI